MKLPNILTKIPMSPIFYFLNEFCNQYQKKRQQLSRMQTEILVPVPQRLASRSFQRGFQRLCRDKADIGTAEIQTEEKLKNQLATGPAEVNTNIMVPDSLYNFKHRVPQIDFHDINTYFGRCIRLGCLALGNLLPDSVGWETLTEPGPIRQAGGVIRTSKFDHTVCRVSGLGV